MGSIIEKACAHIFELFKGQVLLAHLRAHSSRAASTPVATFASNVCNFFE
jgi:hypothetical protein